MKLSPNDKMNYPTNPGVYRMINAKGDIVYIGKAKNLKNRLSQYFDSSPKSPRIQLMVLEIDSIDITSTATENDALILERKLINTIKPKYNILFRDDKSYPYVVLSKHKFPKIFVSRDKKIDLKKSDAFGPYPITYEAYKNVELVQDIFKLRVCGESEFSSRSRPCMLHAIGKCLAPCVNQDDKEFEKEYVQNAEYAKNLLKGNIKHTIDEIEKQMNQAVEKLFFEKAAKLRDYMIALKNLTQNQTIYSFKEDDALVFNYQKNENKLYLGYTMVVEGVPQKLFHYEVPKELQQESIEDLMTHYIESEIKNHGIGKVIVPNGLELSNLFYNYQNSHFNNQQKNWLNLIKDNLNLMLSEDSRKSQKAQLASQSFNEIFNFSVQSIDCIDISHFSGEATYGGKIRWKNNDAKSDYEKEYYRLARFDDENIDDIFHMEKTVEKIYHGNEDFPDILIIDGDKPQMQAAKKAIMKKNITKPYILMCSAKGVSRKKGVENFYIDTQNIPLVKSEYLQIDELKLDKTHPMRLLFQKLQDAAHDFSNRARKQRMTKERFDKKTKK
jgi:excinuclease ABC subunit C